MNIDSKTLVWIGWFLFLMCLLLPTSIKNNSTEPGWHLASATIMVAIDFNDIFHRGWKYLYFAAPSLGNILILLAPLVLLVKKRKLPLILSVTMILYGFLAASYVFYTGDELEGTFTWGYYVWVVSFFVVGMGCMMSYKMR